MNESQLRDRLAAHAAATTTDRVAAWDRISAGRQRPSVARRLMPVGALALGMAAVVLAVNIAGDGSRITATGPGAANLPNRPPAIEGSVYGLVNVRSNCPSPTCPESVSTRLNLEDRSVEPPLLPRLPASCAGRIGPGCLGSPQERDRSLRDVQFADGKLWGLVLSKPDSEPGVGIGEVVGMTVQPVAALRQPFGGLAAGFAVAANGRIAWTANSRGSESEKTTRHLYEFDPSTGLIKERLKIGPDPITFGGVAYGPDGQLAVAEVGDVREDLAVRVLPRSGEPRTFKVKVTVEDWFSKMPSAPTGPPTVSFSATGLIAISDSEVSKSYGDTHILDAATGKLVRTIKNAHAQAWSPDGTGILVVRSKTGRDGRLSVAYGPGLAKEKDLGSLPDALTLRTWVAPASAASNLPNRPPAIEGSVYGLAPDRTGCGSRVCPAVHPITFDVTSRSMAPLDPDTQPGEPAGIENIQWQNGQVWVLGTRNGSPTGIGTLARGQLSMVIPSSDLANRQGAQEAHGAHNGSLAVSPEGRIAWTGYRNEADGNQFREVYERAASGGPIRVVYRSDQVHLGGLVYGPDGTLAVFELDMASRDAHTLMLIGPNGVKRRITVPRDEQGFDDFFIAPTISWSSRGMLAVSAGWIGWGTDPTYIIDATTGKLVRTIKNAHAQAWSPDGTGILVVRSKTGRDGRLSVAYGPGLAKEKDLGALPDALTLRTWVAP